MRRVAKILLFNQLLHATFMSHLVILRGFFLAFFALCDHEESLRNVIRYYEATLFFDVLIFIIWKTLFFFVANIFLLCTPFI